MESELVLNRIVIESRNRIDEFESSIANTVQELKVIKTEAENLLHNTILKAHKLDIDEICSSIDIVYNGFATKIMECTLLTDKEKLFCILYRTGISPKVIGLMLDISLSRVYTRRNEITRKLQSNNLIEQREYDDFTIVLDSFSQR